MAQIQVADKEVGEYLDHISAYEREFKTWTGRVRKLVKKYRMDDVTDKSPDRFNVLWSNVQTLKAATYARMPKPDVSRRYGDNDPVARVAALILERALEFEVDAYPDFRLTMLHVVYDRFLGGRGTAWVRYHPITKEIELEVTEDEKNEVQEVLDFETSPTDYVHWEDFGHNVARTWEEVSIVWRKVYLTREAAIDRFGEEEGKKLPMDATPNEPKRMDDSEGVQKRGLVYEIWDKDKGKAFWMSKSLGKFLDERVDPLEIDGFFPCPRPIFSTLTPDSLVPVPDYTFYQDQAVKLDELSTKISGLIESLKVVGVYDASAPEIVRLFKEGVSGDLIPVQNWQAFAEKKGLSGSIDLVDVQPIAAALKDAYEAFEQVKGHIYELTGIADIIRGQTAPSETATAQQIKNNYASLRLKVYQDEVERFAADLFKLKASIICRHFDQKTLLEMAAAANLQPADQQLIPFALQLLKDNVHRKFRVEVVTDSMAYQDEQQEKQSRMEFLQSTAQFIQQVEQASQSVPQLLPLGIEMLKFGVTAFKAGKTLEGIIDQTADQMKQVAQQPKPNPEMMKMQGQQQIEQAKMQSQQQIEAAKMQHDIQLKQADVQAQAQIEAQRSQADIAIAQHKADADARLEMERERLKAQAMEQDKAHQAAIERMKLEFQAQSDSSKLEFERWKAQLDSDTKIAIADMQAKVSLSTADKSAESAKTTAEIGAKSKLDTAMKPVQEKNEKDAAMAGAVQTALEGLQSALEGMSKPRTIVRDANGKITGVK